MPKKPSKQWLHRPLLTETLPYEVPVIFNNDKFYYAISRTSDDAETQKALKKILDRAQRYTKPYNYAIRKDETRSTTLSIVHPLWQVELCRVYSSNEGSLLSFCAKSEFSLRRPSGVASVYTESLTTDPSGSSKTGIVQIDPSTEEIDTTHIVSYFTYSKYNLLHKFYESREFLRLEERFPLLRTLDISKCFYNIYTHSISWAVKSKEFAKQNANAHSFEGSFDKAMQMANYNETNGIVVGPEISRIFSEIILQEADLRIQRELFKKELIHEVDYAIRRYVDDYSVFARTIEDLNAIEKIVAKNLEEYKLYLNSKKIQTFERPFISPLSLARAELGDVIRNLEEILEDEASPPKSRAKKLRVILRDIRGIVKCHGIEVGNISGWVISSIKRLIDRTNAQLLASPSEENFDKWLELVRAMLELAFYLCALDLRVRTTYSLCQIVKSVFNAKSVIPPEYFDQIHHLIGDQLIALARGFNKDPKLGDDDMIELFNVLICGSHFLGEYFTSNTSIHSLLSQLLNGRISYFRYISLKFCFLSNSANFTKELADLNNKVHALIIDGEDPRQSSEHYLLLCDYISSPDVDEKEKRKVFDRHFGGTISTKAMAGLVPLIGFVDWRGVNVDHTLKRKELRPVYSMA